MYDELIMDYPKSRALEIIATRHQVSRQCVIYHLFAAYKEIQKNRPSKQWSYEKQNARIHKRRTEHSARYTNARNHIDDLIFSSYQRAASDETMTLEDLSYTIHEITGIFFKPDTILGLASRYEANRGQPLLIEVPDSQPARYRLPEK